MKNVLGKYKKLTESKSLKCYKEKLNIKDDITLYEHLIQLLRNIINYVSDDTIKENAYFGIYKLLNYIDEAVENINDKEQINTIRIYYLMEEAISKIKQIDKSKRCSNEKIVIYKEIANRLENLELNINYNKENINKTSLNNYNIIKNLLIEIKDLTSSEKVIKENGYLINAYNNENDNIINTLTDQYIKELINYMDQDINYNLCYYEAVISTIFENKKIKIDKKTIKQNINKCLLLLEEYKDIGHRKRIKMFKWINHLINILDDRNYKPGMSTINNLYNINTSFEYAIREEGKLYHQLGQDKYLNPDTQDFILSIDDVDNYNRDDAFSISKENDKYKLKIYISDPNSLYEMSTLTMQEARKRSQSIYLPDKTLEMFPEQTIKNILSLDAGKRRLARIYNYTLSETGEVLDFKIEKRPIIVKRNLSYQGVNDSLYKQSEITKTINMLKELKDIISNTYNAPEEINSESLIEVLMMFNNINVAKYFKEHNLPLPYRYFEYKKNNNFEHFDQTDENTKKIIKIIKSINNTAYFSSKPMHHDALKTDHYCYSTSPNRRYADILVNECQDKLYFDKLTDKQYYAFEEYLNKEIDYLNQKNLQLAEYYKRYAKTLSNK